MKKNYQIGLVALPALILVLAFCVLHSAFAQAPAKAALHLVFVMDGLRPDGITASETPILFRLGNEGVIFEKDRKSTRLNSSHVRISYAVFCLKKKTTSPT